MNSFAEMPPNLKFKLVICPVPTFFSKNFFLLGEQNSKQLLHLYVQGLF